MQTGAMIVFTGCGPTRSGIDASLSISPAALSVFASAKDLPVSPPVTWNDMELEPHTGNSAADRLVRGSVQSFCFQVCCPWPWRILQFTPRLLLPFVGSLRA